MDTGATLDVGTFFAALGVTTGIVRSLVGCSRTSGTSESVSIESSIGARTPEPSEGGDRGPAGYVECAELLISRPRGRCGI